MKTLTKAAISAAAVMAITTGTLALTASAAVNAIQYDLPQVNYSANTDEREITDKTPSLLTYSVTDYTKDGRKPFYCVNGGGSKITTNAINKGTESSMKTISSYETNYKWCSVSLEDTERESRFITSLTYQNTPNAGSVKAVLGADKLKELNGTIKEGFYVFSINEGFSSSAATLSNIHLTVELEY